MLPFVWKIKSCQQCKSFLYFFRNTNIQQVKYKDNIQLTQNKLETLNIVYK